MVAPAQPFSFTHTTSSPRLRSGETPDQQSFEAFRQQIVSEFIEGRKLARTLFQAAIVLVRDTAILDGGEVSYPIVQLTGLKVLALLSPLQRLDWSLSSNSVPIRLSEMHAIMEQFIVSYEPRGPSPPTANNQPLRPLFSVKSTCEVSAL